MNKEILCDEESDDDVETFGIPEEDSDNETEASDHETDSEQEESAGEDEMEKIGNFALRSFSRTWKGIRFAWNVKKRINLGTQNSKFGSDG